MITDNDQVPDEMTIHEVSACGDEQSAADYASHVVEFEYTSDGRITAVAIAADLA